MCAFDFRLYNIILSFKKIPLRGGPLSALAEPSLCFRFLFGSCFFADDAPIDRLFKLFDIFRGPGGFTIHVDTKS